MVLILNIFDLKTAIIFYDVNTSLSILAKAIRIGGIAVGDRIFTNEDEKVLFKKITDTNIDILYPRLMTYTIKNLIDLWIHSQNYIYIPNSIGKP